MNREPASLTRRTVLATGGAVATAGVIVGGAAPASGVFASTQIVNAQKRLNAQGFWCGPANGTRGELTIAAVKAYQKTYGRKVDGVLDGEIMQALTVKRPQPRFTTAGKVVEVDLKRQVLRVVNNGVVLLTLHASTGGGTESEVGDRAVLDRTPRGRFRIRTSAQGIVTNSLGSQYRPHYFVTPYGIYGRSGMAQISGATTTGGVAVSTEALDLLAGMGHLSRGRLVLIG